MKNKLKLLIVPICAMLVACAHEPRVDNSSLYERFVEYRKAGRGEQSESQYYSERLWNAMDKARKNPADKQGVSAILLKFPDGLVQISGNKERISDNQGCLMVMGSDANNTPADYFILFKQEHGRWVFDEINIRLYLDGTQRFLRDAICDEEEQNKLWIEYMQSQN